MKLFVQEKDHLEDAIQMFIVLSNMNDTHKNFVNQSILFNIHPTSTEL